MKCTKTHATCTRSCRTACEIAMEEMWGTEFPISIPPGYALIKAEDAEDARLGRFVKNFDIETLEQMLERMKYVRDHPEEFPALRGEQ